MNTVVLKFGGSSVADNSKLNVVANKILEFREKFESIVVVVSAQGKTTDKLIKEAQKLPVLSYDEMMEISNEGAKVLHNHCVEVGKKFKIPIITKSTFNHKAGTIISDIIEENTVKSIIKKDISRISIVGNGIIRNISMIQKIFDVLKESKLELLNFEASESKISITFKEIVSDDILSNIHEKIFNE